MDDDPTILEFIAEVFEVSGYDAVLTENGEEAIERFLESQQCGRHFDLVILGWIIPGGMGGGETIEALRKLDPTVKAIVSSGYSN